MDLPTYFEDFSRAISLTIAQREALRREHTRLRQQIQGDPEFQPLLVTTFLQGSYRRGTGVRGGGKPDIDIVLVTRLDEHRCSPEKAIQLFVPFLKKHYHGQWARQGRSLGVKLDEVDLDLVVAASPALADIGVWESGELDLPASPGHEWLPAARGNEWKLSPLRIPDRQAGRWISTDPLAQGSWTRAKNARCGGHFTTVVKAIKWWRHHEPSMPDGPGSYPLERIVGEVCPDGTTSVAEGIVRVLEQLEACYHGHAASLVVPELRNPGVPDQNVLQRIAPGDFASFIQHAGRAARLARVAFDEPEKTKSVHSWRELLGESFPAANGPSITSDVGGGRFG